MARDIINFEAKADTRSRLAFLITAMGIESMSSILRHLVVKESDAYGYVAPQPCPDQSGQDLTNHQ